MPAPIGSLGSVGVGTEGTPFTAATPTLYIPVLSESFQMQRNSIPSQSLLGDRMVQQVALGTQAVQGGFVLECDGVSVGQAIYYWNGNAGYAAVALAGVAYSDALPTVTPAAGGSIPDGTYRYRIATVLSRTSDGQKLIMPSSAERSTIIYGTGNNTGNISWVAPTAVPTGFTQAGTIVYRTIAGGAADSETYIKYVTGTGTSTTDTGAGVDVTYNDLLVLPILSAPLYSHTYIGTAPAAGVDPLKSFSASINKANDYTERYIGCRMGDMNLSIGDPNAAIQYTFGCVGQRAELIANTTPSFSPVTPFVGWSAYATIDGTADCTIQGLDLSCKNNVEAVPGLCGVSYATDIISGARQVDGNLKRTFGNHNFWSKVLAGTEFGIRAQAYGQCMKATGAGSQRLNATSHNVDAVPFQFWQDLNLYRCRASQAGGPIGGPGRIDETVNFTCFKDLTEATEMRIKLINTISAYS